MHGLGRAGKAALVATLLVACGAETPSAPSTVASTPSPATTTAAPTTAVATTAPTVAADYVVVAIGDSIPYNSDTDCPGCVGFVEQYGMALAHASGKTAAVINNAEHNNNTVELLLAGLTSQQNRIDAVAGADAVIVGIAHNDTPMNRDDDSCDGPSTDSPDWSKYTDDCIATEVARFTPLYDALYARLADLRAGKPTILRTINRYNDWNGSPGHDLSAAGIDATARVIKAWNAMICAAAEKSGFLCGDISTAFNGPDGKEPSRNLLAGDYTHPSQAGNDVITEVLVELGFEPLVH